ncbi:MAG: hypothetical protein HY674_00295, partial [Chloroflexi bacterium]|nr:hypothetical protein [Chloroflexota bacterium]
MCILGFRFFLFSAILATLSSFQVKAQGVFSTDFNSGLPPITTTHGNAYVDVRGGITNSGVLKLTRSINSQQGSFLIEDFSEGSPVYGFSATFKVRFGGGSAVPADGLSFCWAENLSDASWGEEGAGGGLIVSFDIYDNGGGEAPAIDVRYGGV